jgi:hypothetical protein
MSQGRRRRRVDQTSAIQKYQWYQALGQGAVHFIGPMARESTMGKMSAEEKKSSRVFPCFLHLKILKVPFWAT